MGLPGQQPPGGPPAEATGAHAAPGPALLLAALAALLLPLLAAALMPQLPATLRGYLPLLPLPLLEIEFALAFAILVLPAFRAPSPEESSPAVTGLVRGLFLGLAALPFALAARIVWPAPAGAVLAGCVLVAALGAGAAASAAAFGVKGLMAAVAAATLPGLVGFFGEAADLPLGWLGSLCPFLAADAAARGGAAWTLGLLPGIALLAASQVLRPGASGRSEPTGSA
jgi:hypothetical protein